MDIKKWVLMAVSVITAAVVFGACLPVFADTTQTEDTLTNEGLYRMAEFKTTDEFNAVWDHTDPYNLTVNDEAYSLPNTAGTYPYTIIGGPDFMVRLLIEGANKYIQAFIGTATSVYEAKTTSGGSDMSISLTSGVMTFDNGSGTTKTVSLTAPFYARSEGDYIMKNYNATGYIKEDSTVIAIGNTALLTTGSNVGERFTVIGNIEDGFTMAYSPYEITTSPVTADYVDSTNTAYKGLYDFSNLSFVATYDNTDTDVTYSQMLIPYEITAERAIHPEGATKTLMELLPVLIGAGLLLGVVGAVIVRKL